MREIVLGVNYIIQYYDIMKSVFLHGKGTKTNKDNKIVLNVYGFYNGSYII